MNSSNSMIAGAASLYGDAAAGTNFGGSEKYAHDGSGVNHRSLNGWIMKSLANASAAFQSDGYTAATDDSNFHWDSLKRGMIFRVNIGEENDATKYVARTNFSGSGAPSAGHAITELQRIKEIGYGDVSAIDTAAQEGVELHDGDLFQVVTVPSGAAGKYTFYTSVAVDSMTADQNVYVAFYKNIFIYRKRFKVFSSNVVKASGDSIHNIFRCSIYIKVKSI